MTKSEDTMINKYAELLAKMVYESLLLITGDEDSTSYKEKEKE